MVVLWRTGRDELLTMQPTRSSERRFASDLPLVIVDLGNIHKRRQRIRVLLPEHSFSNFEHLELQLSRVPKLWGSGAG